MIFCLLALALSGTRPAAAEDSVKFQPTVLVHECPATFTLRADCATRETPLPIQQLTLGRNTLGMKLGSWDYRVDEPVPALVHVLVLKSKNPDGGNAYSVASEVGLAGQPPPMSNGRLQFRETALPENFGVTSQVTPLGNKKYIVELRIEGFHGNLPPPAARH